MRFVYVVVCGAIAFFLYPVGVFHTPFAQLTLGKVFSLIGAILFGIGALISLFENW